MTRRIAATGAGGFLGRHIAAALDPTAFQIDNMPLDARRSLDGARAWLAARDPVALIHLAGIVDVRACHDNPPAAFNAHVLETVNLLEAVRLERPDLPVFYVATDKSFGEQRDCGLTASYRPSFPYDASKACEDMLVECYRATYGLQAHLLRFPNFYGEGDLHHERLIPSVCLAAARDTELVVRTRLDGAYRQYIYVKDAASILLDSLNRRLAGEPVWPKSHFGPDNLKSVGDVIQDVQRITGRELRCRVLNMSSESSIISLRDENDSPVPYTDWAAGLGNALAFYAAAARA